MMFCKTLPTRIVVIQSHIQNTNAMIVAIGECQTSPLVKSFKLREPQTSKTWKLLNCHLPDLQSLHHECILLQEKFCLDDKKDLKTSELRLLQFSSMVHGVIDQINRYNSSRGSLDLRQMQYLESTISSKILPVKACLLGQLQEAQSVEKFQQEATKRMGHWTIPTFDSSSDSVHSQHAFLQDSPPKLIWSENQRIQSNVIEQIDSTMTINPPLKNGKKSTVPSPSRSISRQSNRHEKLRAPTEDDFKPMCNNLRMTEATLACRVELYQENLSFDANSHRGYEEGHFDAHTHADLVLLDETSPSSYGETDFENDFENEGLTSKSSTTDDDFMSTDMCSFDGIDFDWLNPNFPGGGDGHLADITDSESLNGGLPALSLSNDSCSSRSSSRSSSRCNSGHSKGNRKRKSASADSDSSATPAGQRGPGPLLVMAHSSEPEPCSPSVTMACPPRKNKKMNKVCAQTYSVHHKHGHGHRNEHERNSARGKKRRDEVIPHYPQTTLQAEYLCSVCKERYQSTVNENPWWAVLHQECPHCNAMQVPRIDIHAASNAIESNPNFFTLYWEGADDKDNDDFDSVKDSRVDEEASRDCFDSLEADPAPK